MLLINPNDRIALDDLQTLEETAYEVGEDAIYNFELNLSNDTIKNYADNNDIAIYDVKEDIQERIEFHKSYWAFGTDKKGREEIKIACNDLVFVCSAREGDFLFCFQILNHQVICERLHNDGEEFDNIFTITICTNHNRDCDDVQVIKDDLKEEFELKQIIEAKRATDVKSIKNEEELLAAESKTIKQKNTKFFRLKEHKKGESVLVFEVAKPKSKDTKQTQDTINDDEEYSIIWSTYGSNKDFDDTNEYKRDFKPNDNVILEEKDNPDNAFKLKVKSYLPDKEELILSLEQKQNLEVFNKKPIYQVSYDYQMEEILWNKKDRALQDLKKANVKIPDLIRKINEPREMRENVLIEIEQFYDENLDSNQKDAVIKALSLKQDSEILLIQGPPSTGKTTNITEMLMQILKRHRHHRILISSQSNQAVDNVLENIVKSGEDKILRIGNNEDKMSEIARKYTPQKVLNKLIKENLERIRNNPISDENSKIDEKLKALQYDFTKRLQSITSKMALNSVSKQTSESDLAKLFTKSIHVIFGTLLGISSWKDFRAIDFDIAIVDEAGRATLSELLVPLGKAKKIVLVGDHKQLAPVIDDEISQNLEKITKKEAATSLFERLFERMYSDMEHYPYIEHFKHTLSFNYRAEPRICELYSKTFYDGKLEQSEIVKQDRGHNIDEFHSSVVWADTSKRNHKEDRQVGTGKQNVCNANIIVDLLQHIQARISQSHIKNICIITPYKAQVDLLRGRLKDIKKVYKDKGIALDIGTVDSFQGSDRDLIIYDCVRSAKTNNDKKTKKQRGGNKINFIADEKRLNVSLSLAKRLLIIVGDMEFLYTASVSEGSNPFEAIINYIKHHRQDYQILEKGVING